MLRHTACFLQASRRCVINIADVFSIQLFYLDAMEGILEASTQEREQSPHQIIQTLITITWQA